MFPSFRDFQAATSRRPVERALCVRGDREKLFRRGVGSWWKKSRAPRRRTAACCGEEAR
jgi:hypothetical protein